MKNDIRFSVPLYTTPVAAFHLGMSSSSLRNWMNKRDLLDVIEPATRNAPKLPFISLVQAQVFAEFRKAGLSMQAISAGMIAVKSQLGTAMFERGRLACDGKDILVNLADGGQNSEWMRAKDSQLGIQGIIEYGLKLVTWADDNYPQSIKLTAYGDVDVIVNPEYAFGQPIIAGTGAKVEDVVDLFLAGENISVVAEEMMVPQDSIESIIRTHVYKLAA